MIDIAPANGIKLKKIKYLVEHSNAYRKYVPLTKHPKKIAKIKGKIMDIKKINNILPPGSMVTISTTIQYPL